MKSNKTYSFISRFVVVFVILVALSWLSWLWWRESISAVDPQDKLPVSFSIKTGEDAKTIAANLSNEHIIRSPTGFYVLVKLLGIERQLQAGEFRLSRAMDAKTIALELTHGISDQWVTTLEGWRKEEIASKVAKDMNIPEQEILKLAQEGYMFPDTYLMPLDATAGAVVSIFRENFDRKVTAQMREDAVKTGLTFDEALVLASIVEREGRTGEDRPVIAGILLKRLKASWPLQADATLQYALGYQTFEKSWWKKALTNDDKNVRSPYNTYMNPGLPPGPISNPGLESIKAAIYPTESEYWYYLHDPAGGIHYGKTIEEHNANIEAYLR